MSYQAKTDWKYDETVTENDLNRIEQGVKEAHEKSTENQQDLATHLADYAQHIEDEYAHGIGDKSALKTVEKGTIVNAVNELFTNVSDGKNLVGGAITDVDDKVNVPTDPTFQELADAIGLISTGKKWASGEFVTAENINMGTLEISGLDFTPRIINVYEKSNLTYLSIYNDYTEDKQVFYQYEASNGFKKGDAEISKGYFKVPFRNRRGARAVWFAFE